MKEQLIPVELLLVDLEEFDPAVAGEYRSSTEMECGINLMDVLRSDTKIGKDTRKKLKIKEYKKVINICYGEDIDDINDWYLETEHAIRMTFLPHTTSKYCNNIIGDCK